VRGWDAPLGGESVEYTQGEIDDIEQRWNLRFPPDLVELMRERRPLLRGGFDWLKSSTEEIREMLDWPYEGLLFDVQRNDLWWPEWGPKPELSTEQAARLREALAAAPKLIPLYGHRYLPETPSERGNPVFSVYQADVIYYGADLADWIHRELDGWIAGRSIDPEDPPKEIPFWSEAVRRNR
jgi:hypothetical protein